MAAKGEMMPAQEEEDARAIKALEDAAKRVEAFENKRRPVESKQNRARAERLRALERIARMRTILDSIEETLTAEPAIVVGPGDAQTIAHAAFDVGLSLSRLWAFQLRDEDDAR
jgi:hypothetical protein